METTEQVYTHIKGWGIDSDPENEPTYPIKKYTGDDHNRTNYEKPTQQEVNIEILHSNERPDVPAVFGTTVPPVGLSGALRRFAFRHSENSYMHWLTLVLADRINMVEGVIDDISHGYFPNFFKERGWKADWKYNRPKMISKLAIWTLIAAAGASLVIRKVRR